MVEKLLGGQPATAEQCPGNSTLRTAQSDLTPELSHAGRILLTLAILTILGLAGFSALIWVLVKGAKIKRLQSTEEKAQFARERKMSFDAATQNPKAFLLGFNLYKWGFSSSINDVFRFSIETTSISLGNFYNYYAGDDSGRTVTFILMQDSNFNFEKGHFIDNRGFGAHWFQKSPVWTEFLSRNTLELLKKNRWEIESNGRELLVYRINREILLSEIDAAINDLESILPDLRYASRSVARGINIK